MVHSADRGPTRRGLRLFATPADEPRARRITDVILLVVSTVGLISLSAAAVPPPGFSQAVGRFLASFPSFVDGVWQVLVDLLALLAVALIVAAVVRRRASIARDLVVTAAVAAIIWCLVGRAVEGSWPDWWDALRSADPPAWYPSLRVALPAGVVIAASPHLTRPIRRLGRRLLSIAVVAVAVLGDTPPLGALAGALVAAIAAALVHLAFGSCGGRPGLDLVRSALAELGVATSSIGAADRQPAGLFLVHATDDRDDPLVVKVYGRDAHDAALVTTLWRTVWYREAGASLRLGRLQQVEHEAFLTLFARQAGVHTDTVVTAGATVEDDALLVLRPSGRLLGDDPDTGRDPAVVAGVWTALGRLHRAGIAHGQVDDRHLTIVAGEPGFVDFRGGTVAPSETQRRTDEVQALVTTSSVAGHDVALSAALDALGPDGLAATLPFLQHAGLTPWQRRLLRDDGHDLDELRTAAAQAAGAEAPELQQLRRITLGAVVRVVLPAIALLALISGLAGLDLGELVDQLQNASWWLVVFGVLFTQLPRLTQAVSTLGASPVPLPLGPVYALQLAVSYVNLAIPTAAARIAVNIRFFQRHGVPPGAAFTAGALDSFGGFLVQAALLVGILLLTPASLDLQLEGAAGTAGRLLVLVLAIAVVAIAVVALVPRLRRVVISWARRLGREALDGLRGLQSPRRLGLLFGGNLATEVLFATALGIFTRSLGFPIGLGELLVISISVSLLAGLVPVPGGVGVTEGALTYGLVRAGMPEEVAFAAVLMYRLSSFYLPPIWGFFALRWLEREEHL